MNDLNGYNLEDLSVGMNATFAKTITEADIGTERAVSSWSRARRSSSSMSGGS